jgi:phytoene synthase
MEGADAFAACQAMARRADPDRYFSALFAPAIRRPFLFALYAFNHEVARVAEIVREPMLGEIRLQWWRETLAGAREGRPRAHDVARALAAMFAANAAPVSLFESIIDARSFDSSAETFADFAALEAYLDATSGNVMRLAAHILGAGESCDALAREAGIAYGLCGFVRSFAFHAARHKLYLPDELCGLVGLSAQDAFAGTAMEKIAAAIHQLALRARGRLNAARALAKPKQALPAFLPASLVPLYLRRVRRLGFDPLRGSLEISVHRKQVTLLSAAMRRRI